MAIDSLAKRNSVIALSSIILPIPDGTIDQADRQTLLKVYGGILATAATAIRRLTRNLTRALTRNLTRVHIR